MSRRLLTPPALLLTTVLVAAGAAEDRPSVAVELPPHTVTLQGNTILLSQALKQFVKQTGVVVADRRGDDSDPKLSLDLDRVPFWPALDALARQADARVSLYQPDGVLALVRASAPPLPAAYGGIFRATAKRLTLSRDLEVGTHSCETLVEFTWEPWFEPLLFEVRSYTATFAPDASGKALQVHGQGHNRDQVRGRTAIEVDLRTAAPDRSAPKLASLKGTVAAVGPKKMLTVRFDKLRVMGKGDRPRTHTSEDGVSVTLRRLDVFEDPDRWEVEVALTYPPGGPKFESYQDWLANSRIYLEKPTSSGRRALTLQPTGEKRLNDRYPSAVIVYHFKEGKGKPKLGNPADWTLVYRTPGPLLEVSAPFEFKDLPLP